MANFSLDDFGDDFDNIEDDFNVSDFTQTTEQANHNTFRLNNSYYNSFDLNNGRNEFDAFNDTFNGGDDTMHHDFDQSNGSKDNSVETLRQTLSNSTSTLRNRTRNQQDSNRSSDNSEEEQKKMSEDDDSDDDNDEDEDSFLMQRDRNRRGIRSLVNRRNKFKKQWFLNRADR